MHICIVALGTDHHSCHKVLNDRKIDCFSKYIRTKIESVSHKVYGLLDNLRAKSRGNHGFEWFGASLICSNLTTLGMNGDLQIDW